MDLKLEVIRCTPTSKISNIKSNNKLKMFSVDSSKVLLNVVGVDVPA